MLVFHREKYTPGRGSINVVSGTKSHMRADSIFVARPWCLLFLNTQHGTDEKKVSYVTYDLGNSRRTELVLMTKIWTQDRPFPFLHKTATRDS